MGYSLSFSSKGGSSAKEGEKDNLFRRLWPGAMHVLDLKIIQSPKYPIQWILVTHSHQAFIFKKQNIPLFQFRIIHALVPTWSSVFSRYDITVK